MESAIYKIDRTVLADGITLHAVIYPNDALNTFWADDWDPALFRALAKAGFLTISHRDPANQAILLPQLHDQYSVLDWPNIRLDRHIRRLVREETLAKRDIHLRINTDPGPVCQSIQSCHKDSWLQPEYATLMQQLTEPREDLRAIGIELWDGQRDSLIGGELGYVMGRTYVSLTGFLDRSAPEHNHLGKVQLAALGKLLERSGYAFWNLGQTYQKYKFDLGAKATPRIAFLRRWLRAIKQTPATPLPSLAGQHLACQELLSAPATNATLRRRG
ncbi:MAG: hypothetical protein ACQKBV_06980 [Puniceicoccales bacterium]